jgi:hypothetical protein
LGHQATVEILALAPAGLERPATVEILALAPAGLEPPLPLGVFPFYDGPVLSALFLERQTWPLSAKLCAFRHGPNHPTILKRMSKQMLR